MEFFFKIYFFSKLYTLWQCKQTCMSFLIVYSNQPETFDNFDFAQNENRYFYYSILSSNINFYPIFNKRFDHLKALLTIHRRKKALSAGSLCGPLVRSPNLNAPKGPSYYPRSVILQLQIYYHCHLNLSWKTKTNI